MSASIWLYMRGRKVSSVWHLMKRVDNGPSGKRIGFSFCGADVNVSRSVRLVDRDLETHCAGNPHLARMDWTTCPKCRRFAGMRPARTKEATS